MGALLLVRGIPAPVSRQASDRFDFLGGIALIVGLVTMLLALNRLREFAAIPLGLLSVVAFAGFGFRQSRAEYPIIATGILKSPGFALLNLVSVTANLAAFSVWLLVPYYLTRMPGHTLAESGAILASGAAGAVLASPIGGPLVERPVFSHRPAS